MEKGREALDEFGRLHTLPDALSRIQAYYLMEMDGGEPVAKEFFNINHTIAFMNIGMKSAFTDSILWAIGYIFLGSLIYFFQESYAPGSITDLFFFKVKGSVFFWFVEIAAFGHLAYSTGMCFYMGKYWIGNTTKRAVSTILLSRLIFLASFSLVAYFFLGLAYGLLSNYNIIGNVYKTVAMLNTNIASNIYYFLGMYFRRHLFEAGITILIASALSALLPYLSINFYRFARKKTKVLGVRN